MSKIDSVLVENRLFEPAANFSAKATVANQEALEELHRQAEHDLEQFWAQLARKHIHWQTPFETVLEQQDAPHFRWFSDGRLNVSYNCLDRHLLDRGDKTAILFEGEQGDLRQLSYRQLHQEVCRLSNGLKKLGIEKGDRVVIYMPMVPEAIMAMQACARIGAIHSVVFGGFSAESLKNRIEDAAAKVVITADGCHRGGKIIELKTATDTALAAGCPSITSVLVLKRSGQPIAMQSGRDHWWTDLLSDQPDQCAPEWIDSEHPLFLLYTSGSTGKPKGIQHSSGGYLLGTIMTMHWVFDIQEQDRFWCTADVGWVTGHSYVAYGPLAVGATIIMYEGSPTYPDAGRLWNICERHKVSIFYTAPTAIRALMKHGDAFPAQYDLSKLRLLGTVGEPINPEAWMWYHKNIGHERCPIVDTWWQTETGAIMISPVPGAVSTKPGSCTKPLPGIFTDVVDENGDSIREADKGGFLVIRRPWPSMLRTIWGDEQRYIDTYWGQFANRFYVAGDSARRDQDGYIWIMGRTDDVINVSGHRLGSMEIESALVAHQRVVEAAVVSRADKIKGEGIVAFVVLKGALPSGSQIDSLTQELRLWVAKQIGPIAKPDSIRFADNLPKTRSGKIMRRLLRSIARGEQITQDTSTLENDSIVDQLQGNH